MKFRVKICNGETLSLSVSKLIGMPILIEEIKQKIALLKEISIGDQILTLDGNVLENEMKLSHYQIKNSVLWLSFNRNEIYIHLYKNENVMKESFKLKVTWTETIDLIRYSIQQKKKIPQHWQNLYLGPVHVKVNKKISEQEKQKMSYI